MVLFNSTMCWFRFQFPSSKRWLSSDAVMNFCRSSRAKLFPCTAVLYRLQSALISSLYWLEPKFCEMLSLSPLKSKLLSFKLSTTTSESWVSCTNDFSSSWFFSIMCMLFLMCSSTRMLSLLRGAGETVITGTPRLSWLDPLASFQAELLNLLRFECNSHFPEELPGASRAFKRERFTGLLVTFRPSQVALINLLEKTSFWPISIFE